MLFLNFFYNSAQCETEQLLRRIGACRRLHQTGDRRCTSETRSHACGGVGLRSRATGVARS